jgi:hypothetical protein
MLFYTKVSQSVGKSIKIDIDIDINSNMGTNRELNAGKKKKMVPFCEFWLSATHSRGWIID